MSQNPLLFRRDRRWRSVFRNALMIALVVVLSYGSTHIVLAATGEGSATIADTTGTPGAEGAGAGVTAERATLDTFTVVLTVGASGIAIDAASPTFSIPAGFTAPHAAGGAPVPANAGEVNLDGEWFAAGAGGTCAVTMASSSAAGQVISVDVTGACAVGNTITLTYLGDSDVTMGATALVISTADTLGNGAVAAIAAPPTITVTDTTKPTVTSATLDYNTGALVVTFSETVDASAAVASGFHINNVTGADVVTLSAAPALVDAATLTFTLTEAQRVAAIAISGTAGGDAGAVVLDVDALAVTDMAANTNLIDDNNAASMTADTTAPTITALEVQDSDDDGIIDIIALTFSETTADVAAAANGFNVTSASNHGSCTGESINPDGADLTLNLTVSCVSAYTAVGDMNVVLTSNVNMKDTAGNQLATVTFTSGSSPAITDGAEPVLLTVSPADGSTGNARTASVVATFSEPMNTTFTESTEFTVTPDVTAWSAAVGSVGNTVITLAHTTNFVCAQTYTVTFDSAEVTSANAETLNLSGPVDGVWSFRMIACGGSSSSGSTATTTTTTTPTEDTVVAEEIQTPTTEESVVDRAIPTLSEDAHDSIEGLTTDSEGRDWAPASGQAGSSPYDGSSQEISKVIAGELIRSEHYNSVYYVTSNLTRRPFWDSQSYFTWADSWNDVIWVTDATLATLSLDEPMLPKAGVVLVKVQSDPKVYGIEANEDGSFSLRWVPTEEVAVTLYGASWADYVVDVDATTMHWYDEGDDMTLADVVDRTIMKTRAEISALVAGT